FVVAFANVTDQTFDVSRVVDLINAEIFRAQQDVELLTLLDGKVDGNIAFAAFHVRANAPIVQMLDHRGVKDIDFAYKAGDEQVFRLFVNFTRGAILLNLAVAHQHGTV